MIINSRNLKYFRIYSIMLFVRDTLFYLLFYETKKLLSNIRWRLCNPHNNLYLAGPYDISLITAGNYSYGLIDIYSYADTNEHLFIGDFVSIANSVKFILGGEHLTTSLSPFPFDAFNPNPFKRKPSSFSKGPIVIGNHVWLGHSSIVLSGVNIGDYSIIGAGAVVSKNIPPLSIAVGNPIRIVRIKDIDLDTLSAQIASFGTENTLSYEEIMHFYMREVSLRSL